MILTGIPTSGVVYVEIVFVMTSLWMNQYYYVFGYLFLVYIIWMITYAEVTVLSHLWWWQAFFWGGSIGFYMFAFSLVSHSNLKVAQEASSVAASKVYYGHMLLLYFGAFLLSGSVGSMASLLFICKL